MENMEKVTWRIWESEGLGKALLIGGLLFYIPIINLLLLGYYGRWARQLILNKGMQLPEWADGREIFQEAVRVLVPALVWVLLPFLLAGLLGWGFAGLFDLLYLTLFSTTVAWIPMAVVALLSPPCMTIALIRLYKRNSLRESLDVPDILQQAIRHLRRCLFPMLQFYGLLAIGWPLIGFASFLATLPLLAHLILIVRNGEDDLKSMAY